MSARDAWILVRVRRLPNGETKVTRHQLHIPVELALGKLERMSNLALREVQRDIGAELSRPERNK